jgi:hypothetical protein
MADIMQSVQVRPRSAAPDECEGGTLEAAALRPTTAQPQLQLRRRSTSAAPDAGPWGHAGDAAVGPAADLGYAAPPAAPPSVAPAAHYSPPQAHTSCSPMHAAAPAQVAHAAVAAHPATFAAAPHCAAPGARGSTPTPDCAQYRSADVQKHVSFPNATPSTVATSVPVAAPHVTPAQPLHGVCAPAPQHAHHDAALGAAHGHSSLGTTPGAPEIAGASITFRPGQPQRVHPRVGHAGTVATSGTEAPQFHGVAAQTLPAHAFLAPHAVGVPPGAGPAAAAAQGQAPSVEQPCGLAPVRGAISGEDENVQPWLYSRVRCRAVS